MIKFRPIIGNSMFLGHYGSWWRNLFLDYKYNLGRGEAIIGEFETIVMFGGAGAMIVLAVEKWSGWLMPWSWVIILAIFMRFLKVYIGSLDRNILKIGQAAAEYNTKKSLDPINREKLDRIKNIEKKVAPETYKEEHVTYLGSRK